eukprot:TRINITY_DN3334_c0_g1_i2.p1 TRINITY_DN3334_c0_g1~~TRINITY_DN3334_c0_g1_i2.p1  ORF type:complete len:302 (+),score=55.87 TRINITY_DN3334_c0_g1_i2:1349-2254(+)
MYICNNKAVINAAYDGDHPFFHYCDTQIGFFEFLINIGADVNGKNKKGQSLLHMAITWNFSKLIDLFLKYKVIVDWHSLSLLCSRAKPQTSETTVQSSTNDGNFGRDLILLASSEVLNDTSLSPDGKSLIEITASQRPDWVLELLKYGKGIDPKVPSTLLIMSENFEHNYRVNPTDTRQCYVLLFDRLIEKEGKDAVKKYNFLDIAIQTFNPLHYWTYVAVPKVIQFLVELGADINMTNSSGQTVLHWAYKVGKPNIVSLCKQLGAKEDIVDFSGKIPSQYEKQAKKWQPVNITDKVKTAK